MNKPKEINCSINLNINGPFYYGFEESAIKSIYTYSMTEKREGIYGTDKLGNEITDLVLANLEVIDASISKYLRRWVLSELNQVNLSILRVATYEILFEDTPKQIVVNEALEFAKVYSDSSSKDFIHGVLDKIIKE